MKLFVLDTHTIYRRGLVACLDLLEDVESVADAERVRDAWEHPALFEADLVLVDPSLPGGSDFVAAVREATGARVIVCSSDGGQDAVLGALQAGAVGYLRKDELTPETLACGGQRGRRRHRRRRPGPARAPAGQACPRAPSPRPARGPADRPRAAGAVADRRRAIRRARSRQELCYSERTVKNVLHDVVTKLNARSRSQAVAFAVREGLI